MSGTEAIMNRQLMEGTTLEEQEEEAARASAEKFDAALAQVPDAPPVERDELSPGLDRLKP